MPTDQELAREWAETLRGAAAVIWRNLPFDGEQDVRLHRENAETIAPLLESLAEGETTERQVTPATGGNPETALGAELLK